MSAAESLGTHELNAFVDGELELGRQLAIESRLAAEPALRAEVESLRELRSAVRDHADYHAAPPDLMARLQWPSTDQPAMPKHGGTGARRWFSWRSLLPGFVPGFAAAVLLVWGLNLTLLAPSPDARLLQEVIASHVRSTVGQKLIDVASSDRHTVKPWLSSRLDYSPPVADAPVPGAVFLGGRIDYIDNRPVSALVYRQRQHLIDAYIWPASGPDEPPRDLSRRGFNLVHWVHGGMRFWLVSDINRDELDSFAKEMAKADGVR